MKIIVTACQVPYEQGGAEQMIQNVVLALKKAGHQVELIRFPFKFMPAEYIQQQMDYLENLDFNEFTHHRPEKVISLQFPGYGVAHCDHTVWLIHQHRAVYELYDVSKADHSMQQLKAAIQGYDTKNLSRAKKIYTISKRVSQRLKQYNGLDSTALYQPPPDADHLYCAADYGYIFFPSRVEPLKRQQLLIESAQHTQSDVKFIIAGHGSDFEACQLKIQQLGLSHKVIMIGRFTDHEKPTLYARSLGVFFGPYDEDYGYITLEAQLSSKPVITCEDSGGPLEFIENEHNGFICPPEPIALAEKFDWLYNHRLQAAEMGEKGHQSYLKRNISWQTVVNTLTRSS